MPAPRPPRNPPRASARPTGLSARKVSEWVGLILAVASMLTVGVNQLYSHWKKGEEQTQMATAQALLKTETETKLTVAKAELSDRLSKVEAHADSIDKTGTDYGRSQYSTQSVERAQLKKEVAELQDLTRELAPAVTEIKANVRWLMANAGAPDAVSAAQANPRLRPLQRPRTRVRVPRIDAGETSHR